MNSTAETALLLNPDLPGANWADRHFVTSQTPDLSAMDAARLALAAKPPRWISLLMRLRNFLVGLAGLKPAQISVDKENVGAFPVVCESQHKVVLGFDDWHLDFRIVVETDAVEGGTDVSVSTLVHRKNWFGYAYIFLITPFHILIVKRILANLETPVSEPALP